MDEALNTRLLAAHAAEDRQQLIRLYEEAALAAEAQDDAGAASFFMTHAYVFALEAGASQTARLKAWLVANGRESDA